MAGFEQNPYFLAAGALAVVTAAALALPFFRRRSGTHSRADHDVEAFRAQLREVEQDFARGVLTEAEAESARIELSRRLIQAADAAETATGARPAPRGLSWGLALLVALGVPAIAAGVYSQIGSPSLPDKPLASRSTTPDRPNQELAEAEAIENNMVPAPGPLPETEGMPPMAELIAQLEERLEQTPAEPEGLELLARSYSRTGAYHKSWKTYERLIALDPEAAPPRWFHDMTETMMMATGGYISPEAEVIIDAGLERDASAPRPRHYKALALAQRGETKEALDRWIALLEESASDEPWRPLVLRHARLAAGELGVELPASLAPTGPTDEDRAAAAEMSPEERAEMIESMVSGLAERLKEDPNDLEGWLRLIRAYRVMGRMEDARDAQTTALETFKDDPAATRQLKAAFR